MVLAQRVTLPWSRYVFDSWSAGNRATIKAWEIGLRQIYKRVHVESTRGRREETKKQRDKAVETEKGERERERVKGHHVLFMLNVVSALSAGYSLCPLAYFTLRFSA